MFKALRLGKKTKSISLHTLNLVRSRKPPYSMALGYSKYFLLDVGSKSRFAKIFPCRQ